ncbi:YqjD family protein [Oricola sp.]|uniref:DUF883 family protein n=1 Tax=Oricola sp. TaxID=1979950 RepID=UPI000C894518|nr:hypothetical protein [Ahrensia sp.]MCK5749437.1 DUF883 family protein [Oricola sp.]|tara:strand:+ start:21915 stop:22238 length:324 start_codon:yes stop_codon:yes gene_type:complete
MNTATKTARSNRSEADLAAELDGLRKDFEALAERFTSLSDAGARTARDYTKEKAAAAREKGEAVYSDFSARASELENQAAYQIRRHPLQALGIAAGVGFLAALLTRR